MSVPTGDRRITGMAYVDTARRFAREMVGFANRLPKRQTYLLKKPLVECSMGLLRCVQVANAILPESNYAISRRKTYLQEALGYLDNISTILDMCFDLQLEGSSDGRCKAPNENVSENHVDTIKKERALIRGVIDSDPKTMKKLRDAAKSKEERMRRLF